MPLIAMVMLLWRPIKKRGELMGACVRSQKKNNNKKAQWRKRKLKMGRKVGYCLEFIASKLLKSAFIDLS